MIFGKPARTPRFSFNPGKVVSVLAVAGCIAYFGHFVARASEEAVLAPTPTLDAKETGNSATAVLAGGCFWGVQGVYQHVKGVSQALSGYSGGTKLNPSYEEVSSGDTGHAESVRITYDPSKVSYGQILRIYFSVVMDPTELNFQGPDEGTQYRTDVFFANDAQKQAVNAYIAQLTTAKTFNKPIVTRIDQLGAFFPAEDYHQDFLTLHPGNPYIAINDIPKVKNLQKLFPDIYSEKPVLVGKGKPS